MRNLLPEFIFISAELKGLPLQVNNRRSDVLEDILKDLKVNYTEALGSYKNVKETTFMVEINHGFTPEIFRDIAVKQFNQENILFRDKDKKAFLLWNDNTWEYIGKLDEITEDQADKTGNYTFFPCVEKFMGVKNG